MSSGNVTGQRYAGPGQRYNPNSEDFDKANGLDPGFTSKTASGFISSRYQRTYPIKTYTPNSAPQNTGEGVASLVNRYSLFQYKGLAGSNFLEADYKDSPDSILHTDALLERAKNPTTATIIETFNDLGREGMGYSWADFLYSKYHRKIPNNYLITVRRFSFPIMDNLFDPAMYDHKAGKTVEVTQPELSRAITYMGETAGNPLDTFFAWSNKYVWKEVESEVQVLNSNSQGIQGSSILGIGTTGFGAGAAVSSAATLGSGQNTANGREMSANAGFDPIKETYPNYTEGPQNVIKKLVIQDQGLDFDHEFDIKFEYNLQSHGSINPKMAFLDIMANMLVLTWNNAPFWGGAARWTGNGNFGKPVGDHSLLAGGDLAGFLKSVVSDLGSLASNVFGGGSGDFSLSNVLGGIGDVAGDMLGGWLSENLNSPQGSQAVASFLSGDPTGKWHVTIGNPLNPIAMIGNLVLQDTKWKLHGPLGRDDFPSELEITLSFKAGRPRDKADIEQMFNAGRGRLYYAPQDFPDVLNDEGKEPKMVPGTIKNPDKTGGKGGSGGGDRTKYLENAVGKDNIEDVANTTSDAVNKAWVKIKNIAPFVFEG